MSNSLINKEMLTKALKAHILADCEKAAEEIIATAVKQYEAKIRAVVAKSVLAVIERSYSIERDDEHLVIHVRQESKP